MPDTITAPHGQQTDRRIHVQPREIKEAAFRSLCAAGADPIEAQEGALAVLRAETKTHGGLRLLTELLDANWTTPAPTAVATETSWMGGQLRELDSAGQPPLRTALQLLDLTYAAPAGEVSVIRTSQTNIPAPLWNDLLIRHTAALGRQIVITTAHAMSTGDNDAVEYLTVRNNAVSNTQTVESEAVAALLPKTAGNSVVVMALPDPIHTSPHTAAVAPKPLQMQEKEWQSMYQMSRKYLVPDT
ncbi:hypothetical protein NG819_15425 [Pseudarthrobacter sp. Fe7]|nr:hypothetical protein NG819_15425 [Pseudarthrobacter sp. Fe7]